MREVHDLRRFRRPALQELLPGLAAEMVSSYIVDMSDKSAILDVNGANCASCVYAIEHLGRKVEGVSDIRVEPSSREIHVRYAGNPGSLERIAELVRRLGYDAKVRWESIG
jgi:copper chaperone CopZ